MTVMPLNMDEYVVTYMNNQKGTGGTGKREKRDRGVAVGSPER
jgi:hypothetical protein